MATRTRAETALVDTNVLLDATDVKRARHAPAMGLLERRRGLVMSAQIAREYLAVATRPAAANGLGMEIADAMANLDELRRVLRLLPEEKPLLPTLLTLLRAVPCRGSVIHDALLVATMQAHRVPVLITSNPAHFDRFGQLIRVTELPV
jgi:predicted nucleic acid-binding protein